MKLTLLLLVVIGQAFGQSTELPYAQIPDYPKQYSATAVAARMVDALGFRYYWATEGLRAEDISFSPNKDARTTKETLTHILDLSQILVNSVNELPNDNNAALPELTFAEMRQKTLENIKSTSEKLMKSKDKELSKFKMVFKRDATIREFPFWNTLNGPLADALWHVGQVVSYRRSSGNPFNNKVNVLTGTVSK
ncbi:MAG: hypothetical protein JNM78_12150 [Cyclobacteriaceae bacterium]|nr:hypothetical protein [Cyclobacteriaceae bacterium]